MSTMPTRALVTIVVLSTAVALAGCAQSTAGSTAPTGQPTPAASSAPAKNVAPPTIVLDTPTDGAVVPSGSVPIAVTTTNLEFVMPSNTNVAGQGHVHFTLDDEPFEMSTDPEYTLENVAPGEHRLKAELVQNDTSSFDPPVLQEITFTAE